MKPLPPSVPLLQILKSPPSNPLDFFTKIAQFSDITKIPFSRHRYLVNDPDSIQRILQSHCENYTKEDTGYRYLEMALGSGLLTQSGKAWEKRRQELQSFFYYKNLVKFQNLINAFTQKTLEQWESYAEEQHYFNINEELLILLAKISAAILFGIDISAQAQQLVKAVHIGNEFVAHASAQPWFPSYKNLRFRIAQKKMHQTLLTIFKDQKIPHFQEPLLIKVLQEYQEGKLDEKGFLGEVKNFFVAGHETTGNALSWAVYALLKHPESMNKLQNEVDSVLNYRSPAVDDFNKLTYLELVIEETLRLYPPIWFIERKSIAEDELAGFRIPTDSAIIIAPYTIQRHPHYWPRANDYLPERFLPENSMGRHKCVYIPFGMGPRICIGKQLALLSAKLILPQLFQHYEFQLAQMSDVKPEALVTLKPKHGIWVTIKKRK